MMTTVLPHLKAVKKLYPIIRGDVELLKNACKRLSSSPSCL